MDLNYLLHELYLGHWSAGIEGIKDIANKSSAQMFGEEIDALNEDELRDLVLCLFYALRDK